MLAVVDGSGEEKRKRQLLVLAIIGIVVVVLAVAAAFVPVRASFSGDTSYSCGTPFRRWRNPNALRNDWRKDTARIEKRYPSTKVSGKTPLAVCPDRVQTRLRLVEAVGAFATVLVAATLGIYWYRFGFIRDPHVY
jgi:hypothetical protein